MLDINTVKLQLNNYLDPYLQADLLLARVVRKIIVKDKTIKLELQFGFPYPDQNQIKNK